MSAGGLITHALGNLGLSASVSRGVALHGRGRLGERGCVALQSGLPATRDRAELTVLEFGGTVVAMLLCVGFRIHHGGLSLVCKEFDGDLAMDLYFAAVAAVEDR